MRKNDLCTLASVSGHPGKDPGFDPRKNRTAPLRVEGPAQIAASSVLLVRGE